MKALIRKEFRENVKLAALGLVIQILFLLLQYRNYELYRRDVAQPLADLNFLQSMAWFCAVFAAVLGWLQIHNERRPELWAFLIHRPITRNRIFLSKAIAGLGLYALAAGLPLVGFIVWARLPGRVLAPFELRMLRPMATILVAGAVPYFAGMLTALRQARWYASRALGLGLAILVIILLQEAREFWQAFALLCLAAAMLITAVWGGFQNHGHYRAQPAFGKAALTGTLMVGSALVVFVAALVLIPFLPGPVVSGPQSRYGMTKSGAIFKVTTTLNRPAEIVDLGSKPLLDAKTGRMIDEAEFSNQRAKGEDLGVDQAAWYRRRSWFQADCSLFSNWQATTDAVWYYSDRCGRLIGYDRATRRLIGSLGPKGFARDVTGGGDRFIHLTGGVHLRTLATTTTVFVVDVEQRTTKPLFTTPENDPIWAVDDIFLHGDHWEYTAVVTKRSIHLLTAEGKPLWQAPYELAHPGDDHLQLYYLEPPGRFALWITPSNPPNEGPKSKLLTHVIWLAADQGAVKSMDLPELPPPNIKRALGNLVMVSLMPPTLLVADPIIEGRSWPLAIEPNLLLLSLAGAVLISLPIGWWLGRRYHFSVAAQVGWAVFHLLFGVPGLLAFLSVQEWPTREACPNCKKPRVVDRALCEHCGAPFTPPDKAGTEIFAPLQAV